MSRGTILRKDNRTLTVARVGEDRLGYELYWLRGMFGVVIGPFGEDEIRANGWTIG